MSTSVGARFVTQVAPLQVARTPGGAGVDVAGQLAGLSLVVGDKVLVAVDGRALWVIGKVVGG